MLQCPGLILFLLILLLFIDVGIVRSQIETRNFCVCFEEVASNLNGPNIIENAGDGTERLFVGEQSGIIYTFFRNGMQKYPIPFLDISDKTVDLGEKGLLGLVFHPKFKRNRRFFVFYSSKETPRNPNYDHVTKISEFLVSARDPNVADKSSEKLIMEIQEPYSNHNGGEMIFDEDGYLLLFVGDGGSSGDPQGFAQNTSSLLGKVLRIDVDKNGGRSGYAIPRDNPFVNNAAFRPEIYAYGVRNIWRCGKDKGEPNTGNKRGRIMCGDVGQDKFESVYELQKGVNFGWNAREAFSCFKQDLCGKIGRVIYPAFAYSHTVGTSVIGGEFYRGCLNPRLRGFYIFGDWGNGKLFRLIENSGTSMWDGRELSVCNPQSCTAPLTNQYGKFITSFGLDESGELYMVSDKLYRIVDPVRNGDQRSCKATRELRRKRQNSATNPPQ